MDANRLELFGYGTEAFEFDAVGETFAARVCWLVVIGAETVSAVDDAGGGTFAAWAECCALGFVGGGALAAVGALAIVWADLVAATVAADVARDAVFTDSIAAAVEATVAVSRKSMRAKFTTDSIVRVERRLQFIDPMLFTSLSFGAVVAWEEFDELDVDSIPAAVLGNEFVNFTVWRTSASQSMKVQASAENHAASMPDIYFVAADQFVDFGLRVH